MHPFTGQSAPSSRSRLRGDTEQVSAAPPRLGDNGTAVPPRVLAWSFAQRFRYLIVEVASDQRFHFRFFQRREG